MRRAVSALLALLIFAYLFGVLMKAPIPGDYRDERYNYYSPLSEREANESVPEHYVERGEEETGSQNIVTSIVVLYRGFDTLGEVTVLFTAATGVAFLLSTQRSKGEKEKKKEPNFVASTGVGLVLPFILLVGAYIFIHGHLTPGGGFPGGAVIATGFVLMLVAYPRFQLREKKVSVVEAFSGLAFAVIGLISLIMGLTFLENYLPKGVAGTLLSAGIIPLIYIAIGFKVGSELSAIVSHMKGGEE